MPSQDNDEQQPGDSYLSSRASDGKNHLVQFFESDSYLAQSVAHFISAGLIESAGAIVIATEDHLAAIETALSEQNIDVKKVKASGQLTLLNAAQTLASLMEGSHPDPEKFHQQIGGLVQRIGTQYPRIRAYGEMVGLLWNAGNVSATIALEKLWNDLGQLHAFSLFCGYSLHAFKSEKHAHSFSEICNAHSHVLPSEEYLKLGNPDDQLRVVALLQQQALSLEAELERRRQLEAELLSSQQSLNDFFENSVVGLHWVDADGVILRANRAELEMIGYSKEEYVGRSITEFHADPEVIRDILDRLKKNEVIRNYPARLKCKRGEIKNVLMDSNVLWRDGKFVHTRCFTRDVTEQLKAQKAIRELEARQGEEKFRLLVENVKDYAIFMLDPEGIITTWNQGAQRIKQYEAAEIIGQHFSRFYTAEDIARHHPEAELKLATLQGKYEEEGWRLKKDGTRFWANVVITALRDPKGSLIGFAKVTRDLTERKRSEDELRLERERFERQAKTFDTALSSSPDFYYVLDTDHRFTYVNRSLLKLWGVSLDQAVGKNFKELGYSADLVKLHEKQLNEVIHTRKGLKGENPYTNHEGKVGYYEYHFVPVLGPDGSVLAISGTTRDVTERKLAEEDRLKITREQAAVEERKRENERVAFLAEASTILASSLDYHKTLKELARLAVPVLADWCTVTIVKEDRTKERVAAVHRDSDKNALIDELSRYYPACADEGAGIGQVIKSGTSLFSPRVVDDHLVSAAKDQRHLEIMRELACISCMVVPIFARGKTIGAISMVSGKSGRIYNENDLEIAEEFGRRAGIAIDNAFLYEAAQKAINARDEFMSIASHELKTPLTSLKLQAQIRSRDLKKGDMRRFATDRLPKLIADDDKQINRLIRLVDDMLDVSRIRSGKLSLRPDEFDLCEMVRDVLSRFADQIEAKGCKVFFNSECITAGTWDRFRIEQVFINLLTNALKYGAGKPIEVRVANVNGRAQIAVSDYGIGIAKDDQDRIFGQFERAVSVNSISGLGIGLYISKKIVEAHGGSIRVESELGKGSTFIVDLPLSILPLEKGEASIVLSPIPNGSI